MSKSIIIAAIQMDASIAPTPVRLQRAERLVKQVVLSGAQLVVLPELFNTGYGYIPENYYLAEPLTGQTVTWLRYMATHYSIHLAGSLMLIDKQEIYNALLLFAPDGRMWRYDKRYPWGWERAYFRGGKGITVASTDLGDIGLMICWDIAHRGLWRKYAGQVDLMVLSSCPPDVTNSTFIFRDGNRVTFGEFGRAGTLQKNNGRLLFGEMVNQQTTWMGVPTVCTVGTGHVRTSIPNGLLSLISYLPIAPQLIKYLPQAHTLELDCDFVQGCKIIDSCGKVLVELEQAAGETFTVAEVPIAGKNVISNRPQPESLLPSLSYFSSDIVLPLLMRPVYRQGVQRLLRKSGISMA